MKEIVEKREIGTNTIFHFILTLPFRLVAIGVLILPILVLGADAVLFGMTLLSLILMNAPDWIYLSLLDVVGDIKLNEDSLYRSAIYLLIIMGGIAGIFTKFAPKFSKRFILIMTNRNILLIAYVLGYVGLISSLIISMGFEEIFREDIGGTIFILGFLFINHLIAYHLHKVYFFCMKTVERINKTPAYIKSK